MQVSLTLPEQGPALRCALVGSMAASHLAALVALLPPCLLALLLLRLATVLDPDPDAAAPRVKAAAPLPLRFRHDGAFKILQVTRSLSSAQALTLRSPISVADRSRCGIAAAGLFTYWG